MKIFSAIIPALVGFAIGFCISNILLHAERIAALETRVTQLESAVKQLTQPELPSQ